MFPLFSGDCQMQDRTIPAFLDHCFCAQSQPPVPRAETPKLSERSRSRAHMPLRCHCARGWSSSFFEARNRATATRRERVNMSAKSADVLLETVESIVKAAKGQEIVVFYGWAHGEDQKTVDWNEAHGGDWEKFLECAKAAGAKILYLNWAPFEEFQVDEALEHRERTVTAGSESGVEQANSVPSRRGIEAYRDKVGVTAVIDMAFVHEDLVHIHQCFAD